MIRVRGIADHYRTDEIAAVRRQQYRSISDPEIEGDTAANDEPTRPKHSFQVRDPAKNSVASATNHPLISSDRACLNHSIPMSVAGESNFVQ